MTTLVCLVSDQHIPNLLTIKVIRPDHLVLVVTNRMKKNVPWFLQALITGGMDYSPDNRHSILEIARENSVEETALSLKSAYARDPNKEWILNITGGTKPMSTGAYMFALENRLKALYIVESDQYHAIDLTGGEPISLDGQHVTATEFLAGYGYDIRNVGELERQNQLAAELQGLGALITEHHESRNLRQFLGKLQNLKERKKAESKRAYDREGLILSAEEHLWISNGEVRRQICSMFNLRENGRALVGRLDRTAVEFLTGRWLEYFVFGLLSPLVPAAIRCLQVGLTTGRAGPGESNEFDVSFMTERSLCMVECKTGSQKHDARGDSVLYKIEAIKAGLRALRVGAVLATTSPNIIDRNTNEIRQALVNRCRMYGFTIISGKTLKELAVRYRQKDPLLNDRVADLFLPGRSPGIR